MALAGSFGSGTITPADLAAALQGAVIKDEEKDRLAWKEYLENVMKKAGERLAAAVPGLPGAGAVMDGPVFFGVRHLSPAAAFRLRQALDACRPQLILVEGPSDLNEQMHWLCHPETRFPAAILAYTHEPPVRTILYPLAIYSPELQAIHWAHEHQTECRFMDLPSGAMLALGEAVADEADPAESTEWVYRRMEQLTGEEHDTFWERNFEQIEDWQDFQAAVNLFGEQLRQIGPGREVPHGPDPGSGSLYEADHSGSRGAGDAPEKISASAGRFMSPACRRTPR